MNSIRPLVEGSTLWAAYGDALGFITELADEEDGVKWRSGNKTIVETIPWRRKLGGIFGIIAKFPIGTYSDDTQLRLATSRAISSTGFFDVEAFAKIELPIWNCYALGAGRGTKDAAFNLTKKNVRWNSNFYKGSKGGRSYIDSGGNGAAMRIQPHVWAGLGKKSFSSIANDVVRNAITTHGHPHAIIGSVFHALCLYRTFQNGTVPSIDAWDNIAVEASFFTLQSIMQDSDLSSVWLSQWNNSSSDSYEVVHNTTASEIRSMAASIGIYTKKYRSYKKIVEEIDAANPEIRGMASLTAILSLAVAWLQSNENKSVLIEVVNCLGTDTDTIGTMAGALIGAVPNPLPPNILQDQDLLLEEANKLVNIVEGNSTKKFQYPSLLTWQPPVKATDAIKRIDNKLIMPGLGEIEIGERIGESQGASWHWARLIFGQTMIVKIGEPIPYVNNNDLFPLMPYEATRKHIETKPVQPELQLKQKVAPKVSSLESEKILDADHAFEIAKQNNFSAEIIGNLIHRISKSTLFSLETVAAFSVLVSKAINERSKKK